MPRWEGHTPKHVYTEEELAYMREANRKYRQRLRGGKPPMSPTERARLGGLAFARLPSHKRKRWVFPKMTRDEILKGAGK
jgi:hypothetical protein